MVNRYELFSSCISGMYHDIQKIERTEMAKFGLKGPHAHCLLAIAKHSGGITAAQLCGVCEKDKAAISRILAELEQEGMVNREYRNGTRYRASLTLTEMGKAAASAVEEKARVLVELASGDMNVEQREFFYRMLGTISNNLHALCKEGMSPSKT